MDNKIIFEYHQSSFRNMNPKDHHYVVTHSDTTGVITVTNSIGGYDKSKVDTKMNDEVYAKWEEMEPKHWALSVAVKLGDVNVEMRKAEFDKWMPSVVPLIMASAAPLMLHNKELEKAALYIYYCSPMDGKCDKVVHKGELVGYTHS